MLGREIIAARRPNDVLEDRRVADVYLIVSAGFLGPVVSYVGREACRSLIVLEAVSGTSC